MLDNSHNTIITGGTFVASNSTEPRTWIDALRSHCALGALLDSEERFDPPRCAPETRGAIIKEIVDWVNGGAESASMLWLHGAAGAGKSALAQSVAELCQKTGRHAASFFFSRTSASVERRNGNLLVATLVLQLVWAIPEMKPHVEMAITNDPLLSSKSRRVQLDKLFVIPLSLAFKKRKSTPIWRLFRRFTKPPQTPLARLVVIDGLDECNDPEVQCDILRILASALPLLPLPIRFLIASRPESHIVRIFNHNPDLQTPNVVRRVDLGLDADADDNIRVFLLMKFREIRRTHPLRGYLDPSWPSEDAIKVLVQKSSTQFIYPSTVMKYVQHHRGRPDERLDIILGLAAAPAKHKPFAQLDALYIYIFSTTDVDDVESIQRIFGILYLKTQQQYSYLETSPAMIEEYIGLKSGSVTLLLDNFLSLVALPSNHETISISHASLFDFLLDPSRSGDFHLNVGFAHERLALHQMLSSRECLADTTPQLLFRALIHVRDAWFSPVLQNQLSTFPDLYNFLGAFKTSYMHNDLWAWIPILVNKFVTLLTLSDSLRDYLHDHMARLARHLEAIIRRSPVRLGSFQDSMLKERLTYEYRDSLYRSLVSMFFPDFPTEIVSGDRLYVLSALAFEHRDEDDVKDIIKQIFIAAFEKIRPFPSVVFGTVKLFSWLRGDIASNNELDKTFLKVLVSYLKIAQASFDPHEVSDAINDWQPVGTLLDEFQQLAPEPPSGTRLRA